MSNRFKPKFNIKKGDQVIVISGAGKAVKNEKGEYDYKPRQVMEVLVDEGKVLIEGINVKTKHTKPSAQNTKGGIVKKEAPVHISNVMLWDAKANAPSKVKRERDDSGKTVRVFKKSGNKL